MKRPGYQMISPNAAGGSRALPAIAAALLAAAALSACGAFVGHERSRAAGTGRISVEARLPGLAGAAAGNDKSIIPEGAIFPSALDIGSLSYELTLTGAHPDSPQSFTSGNGSFTGIPALSSGDWNAHVDATATVNLTPGVTIASADAGLTITAGSTTACPMDLSVTAGTGSFSFPASWTDARFSSIAVLSPVFGGSAIDLSPPGMSPSASPVTYTASGVPAGIYTFSFALFIPGSTDEGWSDLFLVYVLPDQLTSSNLSLQDQDLNGPPLSFSTITARRTWDPVAASYNGIALAWYGAGGATSYGIERCSSANGISYGSYATLIDLGSSSWGHVDIGPAAGTWYKYRVTASNTIGSNAAYEVISPPGAGALAFSAVAPQEVSLAVTGSADLTDPSDQNIVSTYTATPSPALYRPYCAWYLDGVLIAGTSRQLGPAETDASISGAELSPLIAGGLPKGLHRLECELLYGGGWYCAGGITIEYRRDGTLRWASQMGASGYAHSSPAIGPDGLVYALDGSPSGALYVFYPDGSQGPPLLLGSPSAAGPTIGPDGSVYFCLETSLIRAKFEGGTWQTLWSAPSGGNALAPPALGRDGTLYFGSADMRMYAINPDGSQKWRGDPSLGPYVSPPAIGADGRIYVINDAFFAFMELRSYLPDGSLFFYVATLDDPVGDTGTAIGADGTIYIWNQRGDRSLVGADPADGTPHWASTALGASTTTYPASPVIGPDGTIYVGTTAPENALMAYNPADGSLKWSAATGGPIAATAAIASDGTIYVGSTDGQLYAFADAGDHATGGAIFDAGSAIIGNLAIGADGTVYFGASDGRLYAVNGSSPLADSPWPMYMHNARHTGAALDSPSAVTAPSFYPWGTDYRDPISVSISAASDASVYYSLDGSAPDYDASGPLGTSLRYTGPFTLGQEVDPTIVKAVAVGSGLRASPVVTKSYDIGYRFAAVDDGETLSGPLDLALDGKGGLYVSDTGSNSVLIFNDSVSPGWHATAAGSGFPGFSGDNGPAFLAELSAPAGLTISKSGELFIADYGNQRIRKVDRFGIISTVAGSGVQGFNGDDWSFGPYLELNNPADVCVDSVGRLVFTEEGNHRLRRADSSGLQFITIAGSGATGGSGAFGGDGGPATEALLNVPTLCFAAPDGSVYFTDRDNLRIRKINASGIISTVAGGGASPPADGILAANASFNTLSGIGMDGGGNLYLSEGGEFKVYKVDTAGRLRHIAGNGISTYSDPGSSKALACPMAPGGLAVDSAGTVYAADPVNNRIWKFY
jgi:outer membrane protein assembly factor BamB